jgi:S-adenosylmethionine synthetase
LIAEAQLILEPKALPEDVHDSVIAVIDRELEDIQSFTHRLARGELSVC